jgi:hypothetical protein
MSTNQRINASARSPVLPNILVVRVALRIRRPPTAAERKFLFWQVPSVQTLVRPDFAE